MSKYLWYILGGLLLGVSAEFITKAAVEAACRPLLTDVNSLMLEAENLGKETKPEAGK